MTDGTKRTIVVGCDGSPRTLDAVALGRRLAAARGGRIVLAAVYRGEHPIWPGSYDLEAALRDEARDNLDAVDRAGFAVPVELRTISASSPARGLHELADHLSADVIVVGSSHRGPIGRVVPGSVGEKLLQEAPCAVAIAPSGYARDAEAAFRVVGVGYDMSHEADAAVDLATEIAVTSGGTVRLLCVSEPHTARYADIYSGAVSRADLETMHDHVHKVLEEKRHSLPPEVRADARQLRGVTAVELVRECEKGVDLLVIGSRGYGPLGRALVGSVSTDIVRTAKCPVLLVPRRAVERNEKESRAEEPEAVTAS
jgi:nucleotide-binding universal stress UspA family protein